jgi:hypothetical protein
MVSLYSAMNGNGMAAERKAVEDYLNGGRWKLVGEFTEVESGKRAVAGTCMDNRRATVPFSEVKDAVEGGRLKAIWPQRREPLHNTERAHLADAVSRRLCPLAKIAKPTGSKLVKGPAESEKFVRWKSMKIAKKIANHRPS